MGHADRTILSWLWSTSQPNTVAVGSSGQDSLAPSHWELPSLVSFVNVASDASQHVPRVPPYLYGHVRGCGGQSSPSWLQCGYGWPCQVHPKLRHSTGQGSQGALDPLAAAYLTEYDSSCAKSAWVNRWRSMKRCVLLDKIHTKCPCIYIMYQSP